MAIIVNSKSKPLTTAPVFATGEHDFSYHMMDNFVYVDKTRFIYKWWNSGAKVSLIVRPRRFSKTTILNMVSAWFNPNQYGWFSGTEIQELETPAMISARTSLECLKLSFKDIDASSIESFYNGLVDCFTPIFERYAEPYANYKSIMATTPFTKSVPGRGPGKSYQLGSGVSALLSYMYRKEEQKFVILIDEYDRILETAEMKKNQEYFSSITELYSQMLSTLLKDKDFLEKAIITGVLPLAANSVLSSFNNAVRDTFTSSTYDDIFGFTYEEIDKMKGTWMSNQDYERIQDFLDFYNSGGTPVFNPWSVIGFINSIKNRELVPTFTWTSTGNSDWIKYYNKLTPVDISKIAKLLTGESVTIAVNNDLGYHDKLEKFDNFLTYAFYAGYLTYIESGDGLMSVQIPNKEVGNAWNANISKLLQLEEQIDWAQVLDNLEQTSESERLLSSTLNNILDQCASYWDLKSENSYHMWVLGLLCTLSATHKVQSNREAGAGRFDIAVTPWNGKIRNYVFELKEVDRADKLQGGAEIAIKQVKDQRYYQFFDNTQDIVIIGLSAHKKNFCAKIQIHTRQQLIDYAEEKRVVDQQSVKIVRKPSKINNAKTKKKD